MHKAFLGAVLIGTATIGTLHAATPDPYSAAVAGAGRSAEAIQQDEGRHPAEVLKFTRIKAGQTVADYQAGGGYYTELLARVVGPKGKVYALVPARAYKAEDWDPIKKAHTNVAAIVAPAGTAMTLAPKSVDTIFTNTVYHDLYLPPRAGAPAPTPAAKVLAQWFAAVKPGGSVIVVDHIGPDGDASAIAGKVHRISPKTVKRDMAAAGFQLVDESSLLQRSDDDPSKGVFDPALRGHTSRMMLKFQRP